jgi:antitoxin YobK
MSMKQYEKAQKLIDEAGGGDFEGSKPEALVVKAETALGVKFPPSYRRFLLDLGCGDINGMEVFGLISDNFEKSTVPNGIWLTLNERGSIALDPAYVIVGDGGDGTYYALDTRQVDAFGENPIVRLSVDEKQSQEVAESFGAYLLNAVSAVV